MSQTHRVHLKPEGDQLEISGERTLLYELADHGLLLRSDCGVSANRTASFFARVAVS